MAGSLGGNIVVTGANRGLGLELVRQLVDSSGPETRIYATCRDPEGPGAQALRDLRSVSPGRITLVQLDQSEESSIWSAVQVLDQLVGSQGLNLLLNNAAVNKPPMPGRLDVSAKKDMMDVYETNVVGPFLLGKMCLPLLQRAANRKSDAEDDKMSCRRSAIINVSTLAGSITKCPESFAFAQMYPYRTSKAALNMLTCCQAEDFRKHGILVTALHPGWVRTDMGGPQAPLDVQESVEGMIRVMASLGNEHCGKFLDWMGNAVPW